MTYSSSCVRYQDTLQFEKDNSLDVTFFVGAAIVASSFVVLLELLSKKKTKIKNIETEYLLKYFTITHNNVPENGKRKSEAEVKCVISKSN